MQIFSVLFGVLRHHESEAFESPLTPTGGKSKSGQFSPAQILRHRFPFGWNGFYA